MFSKWTPLLNSIPVTFQIAQRCTNETKRQANDQPVGEELKAEQEARAFVEKQLMEEKKRKKLEEATAARAVAFAAATR